MVVIKAELIALMQRVLALQQLMANAQDGAHQMPAPGEQDESQRATHQIPLLVGQVLNCDRSCAMEIQSQIHFLKSCSPELFENVEKRLGVAAIVIMSGG